ncbi:hypothetical protein K503DRAFT_860892 [Rhizopogon vinicolor AM-OR11-026]|uniref:Uncharacterized protein n=1 Tax=Rhizopogon vinicolor AM-OR11-026 TaxID=1314800 RepID=A0A1B7MEL5_9AGAM|nr:hypothetical protein K503DRAFT_860892 [Rhizopogon vinicolor AM-OR11-026]
MVDEVKEVVHVLEVEKSGTASSVVAVSDNIPIYVFLLEVDRCEFDITTNFAEWHNEKERRVEHTGVVVAGCNWEPRRDPEKLMHYENIYCIVIEAYGALTPVTGQPGGPVDAPLNEIAMRLGAITDQVLLAWVKAKGTVAATTFGYQGNRCCRRYWPKTNYSQEWASSKQAEEHYRVDDSMWLTILTFMCSHGQNNTTHIFPPMKASPRIQLWLGKAFQSATSSYTEFQHLTEE